MADNNFRSDKLEEAIHTYGLNLRDDINWDNGRMIKALGDYFMSLEPERYSWGARYMQSLDSVMLCNHLKDNIGQMKHSPLFIYYLLFRFYSISVTKLNKTI